MSVELAPQRRDAERRSRHFERVAPGSRDNGGDRRRDSGNREPAARQFLDVDARIGQHQSPDRHCGEDLL